jgi:hypothetical protein
MTPLGWGVLSTLSAGLVAGLALLAWTPWGWALVLPAGLGLGVVGMGVWVTWRW